ncbi:GatB/YqeY domain-containing protein [Cytophagaceae bacterium ABcell3]|nr:GatB/YqeY domain-containing protein [Cytophagaceae bacterium ABcell3]
MSLKERIEADIKQAMLNKDKNRLRALRSVKSLILLAESEKGNQGGLSQDAEIKLLTKAAKQRRESAELYEQQGRKDLQDIETAELNVIEEYLPKQLSEEEIAEKVQQIIKDTGAQGPQDMGKVMGTATKELAGQADGKIISFIVKSMLKKAGEGN